MLENHIATSPVGVLTPSLLSDRQKILDSQLSIAPQQQLW